MWFIAAIDPASLTALAIGLMGLGGIVFTALRFRRDDTTAVVTQQDTIMNEMKTIADVLRIERDECKETLQKLGDRGT